jgi:hypothetical protein
LRRGRRMGYKDAFSVPIAAAGDLSIRRDHPAYA